MDAKFFPQTLEQWLTAVAFIGGWWFLAWRAFSKLSNDVNNVGGRVNNVEANCATNGTEIANLRLEQQRSIDDRNAMRERLSASEKQFEALSSELQEQRLSIMTMLHNSEKTAAERDAITREQLARITERLNIEAMVTSVVKQLKAV